jgi:hypothetical protein
MSDNDISEIVTGFVLGLIFLCFAVYGIWRLLQRRHNQWVYAGPKIFRLRQHRDGRTRPYDVTYRFDRSRKERWWHGKDFETLEAAQAYMQTSIEEDRERLNPELPQPAVVLAQASSADEGSLEFAEPLDGGTLELTDEPTTPHEPSTKWPVA